MPSIGPPHRALNAYVAVVASLAVVLVATDALQTPADLTVRSPIIFALLLAVTAIAEHLSFRVHRGWITAAATLPHVTAALLLPPAQAELIGLLGAVSYGLSRRVPLPKLVFNAAVVGLAVGAAAHVGLALGGPGLIAGAAGWIGPLVALSASLTYYLVSVAAVSLAVALDNRTAAWPLARDKLGFLAVADLGLGLTGAILAVILTTQPTWAPALLLPAVLVYLVKRSHERLTTSEARLEAIIGSAMDAIITIDDQNRIVVFNRAAEAMFGYARGRILGEQLGLVLVDEAYETNNEKRHEVRVGGPPSAALGRRVSGETFPVEMTQADLQVRGQHLSTLVMRDITARKIAECERMLLLDSERAARVAAERAIELRDEFLVMAAHELRTPITSLRGYAQLMRRRLEIDGVEPQSLRRALEVIDQQSGKLARLVSLLLDVSAIEAGSLTLSFHEADLAALVRQCVATAQATARYHTITVRTPETLVLCVDAPRLQQVIDNLLENAIRFSPRGGAVEVDLTQPDAGSASLEVCDHGLGVSPEHRRGLFDRFYRAHADSHLSGLGLGLHVSRHIVERHGGSIEVVAQAGGGTRFVVLLPLAPPPNHQRPVATPRPRPSRTPAVRTESVPL